MNNDMIIYVVILGILIIVGITLIIEWVKFLKNDQKIINAYIEEQQKIKEEVQKKALAEQKRKEMKIFDDKIKAFPNLHSPHLDIEFKKQITEKYGDCVYDDGLIYDDFLYESILPMVETPNWTKELLEKYNGIPDLYVYTGDELFPYKSGYRRLIFGWGWKKSGYDLYLDNCSRNTNWAASSDSSPYSSYFYMMNGDILKSNVFYCAFEDYNRKINEDNEIYDFNGFHHNYIPVGALLEGEFPSVNHLKFFGYIIL